MCVNKRLASQPTSCRTVERSRSARTGSREPPFHPASVDDQGRSTRVAGCRRARRRGCRVGPRGERVQPLLAPCSKIRSASLRRTMRSGRARDTDSEAPWIPQAPSRRAEDHRGSHPSRRWGVCSQSESSQFVDVMACLTLQQKRFVMQLPSVTRRRARNRSVM